MISSVLKEFSDAAAQGRLVTVVRRGELEKLHGVPLAVGTRLVLLRTLNPDLLLPDGWVIARVQDVVEVRTTEWDHAVERALASEPRWADGTVRPAVRLDGWPNALADLHARGEPLSVDCEDDEEGYFLGVFTALSADAADMRHIAADGTWEPDDWTVFHDEITRVAFGTRYIDVFARLAGEPPA